MRAIDLIDTTKYFSINEFPSGALEHTHANVLETLIKLRIAWGRPIHPSRHPMGWARMSGSNRSRHFAVGRLSDACDIFPTGNVLEFRDLCMRFFEIGGIGIYFDTNRNNFQPGPMIHIDLRPERIMWSRIGGKYHYLNNNIEAQKLTYSAFVDYLNSV